MSLLRDTSLSLQTKKLKWRKLPRLTHKKTNKQKAANLENTLPCYFMRGTHMDNKQIKRWNSFPCAVQYAKTNMAAKLWVSLVVVFAKFAKEAGKDQETQPRHLPLETWTWRLPPSLLSSTTRVHNGRRPQNVQKRKKQAVNLFWKWKSSWVCNTALVQTSFYDMREREREFLLPSSSPSKQRLAR